jgi:hypothetical protein
MIQTEHDFQLPVGYQDKTGTLHRDGTMRLATAADEIHPLADRRVQSNQAYLIVILLSRVITRLGGLPQQQMGPHVIEGMYAADLAYLQEFYNRINRNGHAHVRASCPECNHTFDVELNTSGES